MNSEIPLFLRKQLDKMPYHQFIELTIFLDNPNHNKLINEYFGKVLERDVEIMNTGTESL